MALRTTQDLVLDIIEVDLVTWPDLTSFMKAANHLINRIVDLTKYTADELQLIETWLAAHFAAIADMRRAMEKAGDVSESFQHKLDLRLDVTMYGQQAMILETEGALAAWNEESKNGAKRKVGVIWLGTEDE